jgi:hypothetical protein
MEWESLLLREQASYVMGNPPFIGSKYQSTEQRRQVQRVASLGGSGGTLDYVSAWFLKAAEFAQGTRIGCGFVSTNSITQGEQVGQLWPLMFERYGMEITFAHRTFAWGSDARGRAHVHVVIIGFGADAFTTGQRRLFSYTTPSGQATESLHAVLSPYLIDASLLGNPHSVVVETARALNGFPPLVSGSQPIDGGHFIFSKDEYVEFLRGEPSAREMFRPDVGTTEFLSGEPRYILDLALQPPERVYPLVQVRERVRAVKEWRSTRSRKQTAQLADTPQKWYVRVAPESPFLVIPKVSSERREYIPMGWAEPPTVPSDLIFVSVGATLFHFGFVTSAMHMSWVRHIAGRHESRFRYGVGSVYNTFPVPSVDVSSRKDVETLAGGILEVRKAHSASLEVLYDPDTMPVELKRAHLALDKAVDRIYRKEPFTSDRERAEHLLSLYEKMVQPLALDAPAKRKRVAKAK